METKQCSQIPSGLKKNKKYFEMYEDEYTTWQKLRNSVKTMCGENYYLWIPKRPPWCLTGKESTSNAGDAGDMGLISGLGRFPGGRNGNPLQYSCLDNPLDRGTWWATVHGVTTSQTWWSTTRTTTKVLIHYCYLLLIFIFCISPTAQHNAGME